jgi:peptidoglycan-N-acetylmuramic acid deacetylase
MKFPFFCLLKEFPRDHDQIFAGSRPAALLLALILLPLSYVLGAFAATVIPSVPASADGNWGLSFQQDGKPPVANATADELKQYNTWYADLSGEKVIYLTFDAGYENGNTPMILDALKKHQVPAAFFVVGNYLETSPDLVKRMVAEGHIVANHTYHHPDMSKISDPESFAKELSSLETSYTEITGETMRKYYRPPQGKYSKANLQMAKALGYQTFFWSLAYVDWYQDQQPTKEEAFKKLLGRIHPGAIVLLHSTSSTNAAILDELLTKWEEMGYRFGTLDELVRKAVATQ